jgi:hypothetical protein
MFLNQFGIALLGLVLALAFGMAENYTWQVVSSVFAVLFYLFLIYYMTWEVGARDGIRIEHGRMQSRPLTGLYMSLLANTPNFILAILATAIKPFGSIAILLQGMYAGIMTIDIGTEIVDGELVGLPLNDAWWSYFLIILPALLVSTISYIFGTKNIGLARVLAPDNPEQEEIKRMKKQNKRK